MSLIEGYSWFVEGLRGLPGLSRGLRGCALFSGTYRGTPLVGACPVCLGLPCAPSSLYNGEHCGVRAVAIIRHSSNFGWVGFRVPVVGLLHGYIGVWDSGLDLTRVL